jgi:hypothetical protein
LDGISTPLKHQHVCKCYTWPQTCQALAKLNEAQESIKSEEFPDQLSYQGLCSIRSVNYENFVYTGCPFDEEECQSKNG